MAPDVGGKPSLKRHQRKQLALTSEAGELAAFPNLPSYAATKALTVVNDARFVLQNAA